MRRGRAAGEHRPEMRGVGHGARDRAGVVERRAQRHDAIERHFAERRLEADDAAGRGRNSNRAAGVGADRRDAHSRGDGGRRSTARAARRARDVVRIVHRAVRRFFARGAERELVEVGLADQHRAGLAQALTRGASWSAT